MEATKEGSALLGKLEDLVCRRLWPLCEVAKAALREQGTTMTADASADLEHLSVSVCLYVCMYK